MIRFFLRHTVNAARHLCQKIINLEDFNFRVSNMAQYFFYIHIFIIVFAICFLLFLLFYHCYVLFLLFLLFLFRNIFTIPLFCIILAILLFLLPFTFPSLVVSAI